MLQVLEVRNKKDLAKALPGLVQGQVIKAVFEVWWTNMEF